MVKKREGDDERYGPAADDVLHGCERLKALLTDLLDVGRLKSGRFMLRKMRMPLSTLIAATLSSFRDILDETRYRIELADQLPELFIDHHCVERILVNLLANAEKYSSPGSTIFIRAWQRGEVVVVAVCDEEEDVANLDRAKLFVPYYRSFLTNTTEGVGLGLHMAKLLVEAQGGEIWADQDEEYRTRYCFTLAIR